MPSTPSTVAPLTTRVSYLNQDLTQKQLGFYAQDQMRFGDGWLVTLNGRYDRGWLEADNRPDLYSASSSTQKQHRWRCLRPRRPRLRVRQRS